MKIFPAIDIYEGKAVRLYKGRYDEMTVYSTDPLSVALDFEKNGATHIHMVDLEGARLGEAKNLDTVKSVIDGTSLFVEIGGGIRNMETVDEYIALGVDRVILGTSAVSDRDFLLAAVEKYGDKIAVGVDLSAGYVAVKGWTERSDITTDEMFSYLEEIGVRTVICTDISKDGAMKGTNRELYRDLSAKYSINVIASGGISSYEDLSSLKEMDIYGAIIGKAYYTGSIDISRAVRMCEDDN